MEGVYEDASPADRYVKGRGRRCKEVRAVFGDVEILDEADGETAFTLRGKSVAQTRALCEEAARQDVRVKNVLKWLTL